MLNGQAPRHNIRRNTASHFFARKKKSLFRGSQVDHGLSRVFERQEHRGRAGERPQHAGQQPRVEPANALRPPHRADDLAAALRGALDLHAALDGVEGEDGRPEGHARHPPCDHCVDRGQLVALAAGEAGDGLLRGLVAEEEEEAAGDLACEGRDEAAVEREETLAADEV